MPFPQNVDLDKLASHGLWDVIAALNGWLAGRPYDETAFISRVTENLARRRRGCDVGITSPMRISAHVAVLHRQGPRQTDRFGSDLAITFYTEARDFVKTVFFQVKKSRGYTATFDTAQLREAKAESRISDRSYVLVADEERGGIRIKKASDVLAMADNTAATVTTNCADWQFLTQWMVRWLSCEEGPASDPTDPNAVESLLDNFVIPDDDWDTPWRANPQYDLPEAYLPAQTWIALSAERPDSRE